MSSLVSHNIVHLLACEVTPGPSKAIMVKFSSFRKALSKKLAPKEDNAEVIATQAAKDAQFQLQMQQYHQWQMQQQQMQMAQQQTQQSLMADADTPKAAKASSAAPDIAAPVEEETVLTEPRSPEESESAEAEPIATQSESCEDARNEDEEQHEEEASTIDDMTQNRDTFEPEDEEIPLANTSTVEEDEEESMVSEEEDASLNTTDDEAGMSYDEETLVNEEVKDAKSYDGSLAACEAVGNQKKFFHKDVVLHNMNEMNSGNDLVIRAMYFVPKPKSPEDVVVRIEVSSFLSCHPSTPRLFICL